MRIFAEGPPVALGREAATTIALCLRELATNALKYGALSRPEGTVHFRWIAQPEESALSIQWVESGGPPVAAPARTGYGTRYLIAALRNLFGSPPRILYKPEGLDFSVSGPLSRTSLKH